jgi:serine/threonine protein kinase
MGLTQTLEERCKKYEGIDERHICRYGMQILQALKYLHSKLVLHREYVSFKSA